MARALRDAPATAGGDDPSVRAPAPRKVAPRDRGPTLWGCYSTLTGIFATDIRGCATWSSS
jgi:hypothetical protein